MRELVMKDKDCQVSGWSHVNVDLRFISPATRHQPKLQDHGHRANALHDVPVYLPAGTKLYCLLLKSCSHVWHEHGVVSPTHFYYVMFGADWLLKPALA